MELYEAFIHKIAALIPCYNVEKYCRPVIEETLRHVSFLILVDDGSTDRTGAILKEMEFTHRNKIHLIAFPKNRGKGEALLKGIKYALSAVSFDVLVSLDSDGQHLPSEIFLLASFVEKGADFVIGTRDFTHMPFRSRFANTCISFLLRRLYPNAPVDTQSGFRAFSRSFLEKIHAEIKGARYEMEFRCILLALKDKCEIATPQIATIYLDKNVSSHFSKIRDSFLIMKVFFKYWTTGSL